MTTATFRPFCVLALTLVLLSVSATAFAAGAGPDPHTQFLNKVSYSGSGCPQGTVGQSLSDVRTTLTLIFDNNVATTGPGVAATESHKNCLIALLMNAPTGTTWSVTSVNMRGYVSLDAGVRATAQVDFGTLDQLGSSRTEVIGPANKDYLVTANSPVTQMAGSPCGGEALLFINTQLTLESSNPNAQGMLTEDSFSSTVNESAPPVAGVDLTLIPCDQHIQGLAYDGNGCPQGTVGQSLNDSRNNFTLIFDAGVASMGPNVPVTENRKSCNVSMFLYAPAGMTWTAAAIDTRGYVSLPSGVHASVKVDISDGTKTASSQSDFDGPVSKDYLHHMPSPITQLDGLTCGGAGLVSIKTEVSLSKQGSGPDPAAQITFDSIDGKVSRSVPPTGLDFFLTPCVQPPADALPPTTTATANPTANANGWNNSPVTVAISATDNTGGSGVQAIHYALSGAQSDTQVVPGAQASVVISHEGTTAVSYFASDVAGNSETAHSLSVRLDMTAPAIVFAGNAGSYTVDQTVAISCNASDALSGLASSTCPGASGPAYTFPIGTTTLSATATDRAGNTASTSAHFSVNVTADGLEALVTRFSTNAGVANGLNAKLIAAANSSNANARAGQIGAFDNQVSAQTGKALTAAQAAILIRLADLLR